MKPTAIQQMVEWLENKKGFTVPTTPNDERAIWREDVIDEARRLASLEANEKPQADAGLMEAIRRVISECGWHSEIASRVEEVLSNYHPAHSTNEKKGGVL